MAAWSLDAASPSPINMLPYYKQMFAESSPLTGPFGRPGPNRIHLRRHQEAATKRQGGCALGEGLRYEVSLTEGRPKRRPSPTPRPAFRRTAPPSDTPSR